MARSRYRESVEAEVRVIPLDRWGRVLLFGDGLPGGAVGRSEAPDAAALRVFEEATGLVLDQLRLYRVSEDGTVRLHVYFDGPDIDPAVLPAELEARYLPPERLADLGLSPGTEDLLRRFFDSGAYRALFH